MMLFKKFGQFLGLVFMLVFCAQLLVINAQELRISGVAVDAKGNPVPNAFVQTISPESCEQVKSVVAVADQYGAWSFVVGVKGKEVIEDIVIEPHAFLFEQHFVPVPRECDYDRINIRDLVKRSRTQNDFSPVNLGRVLVQRLQTVVDVVFEDSEVSHLAFCSGVWLRLRNDLGDIVTETTIPKVGRDIQNKKIVILLPDGKWTLDFSFQTKPWKSIGVATVNVAYEIPQHHKLAIAASTDKVDKVRALSPDEAMQLLLSKGIVYSTESFFERIEKGNTEAVSLFLRAGMNPNSVDEAKRTALMMALDFEDVVELLLKNGADPNRASEFGITPLYIAVTMGNRNLTELLVNSGADPFIKADAEHTKGQGTNAITVAKRRNLLEILEILNRFKPVEN